MSDIKKAEAVIASLEAKRAAAVKHGTGTLLGVKRTSRRIIAMSAFDPKRTSAIQICRDAPCTVSVVG